MQPEDAENLARYQEYARNTLNTRMNSSISEDENKTYFQKIMDRELNYI